MAHTMIERPSVRLSPDDELEDLEAQIEDLRSEIARTHGRAARKLQQDLVVLEARLKALTSRPEKTSTSS